MSQLEDPVLSTLPHRRNAPLQGKLPVRREAAQQIKEADRGARVFLHVLAERGPELPLLGTRGRLQGGEPLLLDHRGNHREAVARIDVAFRPGGHGFGEDLVQNLHSAMLDFDRVMLEQFLEHQPAGEDQEIAPLGLNLVPDLVEAAPPCAESAGQGFVVDLETEGAAGNQQLGVAVEGGGDGAKPLGTPGQTGLAQHLWHQWSEHRSSRKIAPASYRAHILPGPYLTRPVSYPAHILPDGPVGRQTRSDTQWHST